MRAAVPIIAALLLTACAHDSVAVSTAALTVSQENLAQRQAQSRRFDTKDFILVQQAAAGVLQDLGFTIKESSAQSGFIMADKDRDAMETGQVATQLFFAALISAMGGKADPRWDETQKIRVAIVSQPSADKAAMHVRVTFQRVVWDNHKAVSRIETINEAKIYQEFFDKLSQSLFLEAHQI
ncbi:MAG: hypothetical protein JNK07_05380 [Alphaproteobacteria bacterium]|nr:hypothetical protein [Alphaproteobacteria bacterium]